MSQAVYLSHCQVLAGATKTVNYAMTVISSGIVEDH